MKLQTIIVEDDPLATRSLVRLCQKTDVLEVKASFENPLLVIKYLKENDIDLMFLDVEMPEMTGLELLSKLDERPEVIMTTAKPEYAFDAFEYEVVDFLKKPISIDRFNKSIKKLIKLREGKNQNDPATTKRDIFLKVDGRLIKVPVDDILYFENVGDYLKVITNTKVHVMYKTLKSLDAELEFSNLLKVHRSYIVNMDKVSEYKDSILKVKEKGIPVSRSHKPIVKKYLDAIK